ncbi:MAG: hypothetical protein JWP18_83 [Solirubrobacterales bacterium]|nr:hypothetical protein [Solirubrobacterales bacterium]
MSALWTLRKLMLGETWALPVGLVLTLGGSALLRHVTPGFWHAAGPALLPVGVVFVLVLAVMRSLPPRGTERPTDDTGDDVGPPLRSRVEETTLPHPQAPGSRASRRQRR